MKDLIVSCALVVLAAPSIAGVIVNPGGNIKAIAGDPTRDVFYLTLQTNEVVAVASSGSVTNRASVPGIPGVLTVSPNGASVYVALLDTHDVAVYSLPGLTYSTTLNLSATETGPTGLAASNRRLYAASNDGLSVYDTVGNVEQYFGEPSSYIFFYSLVLTLSPDARTLYAMDTGLSPSSLYALDVSDDVPVFIGDDACHGCIGSNGRQVALSPDGSLAYVAVGGEYHLQVLGTTPLLHAEFAGPTGPYPNAVAPAQNGSAVYVGYQDWTFAAVRTSDWLPFHVGALQGEIATRGLALSSSQTTLAAVIAYAGYTPNRVELINVSALPANRGGIRLSPRDSVESVPIAGAYISASPGESVYVQVRDGVLARAPIAPATVNFTLSAPGHTTQSLVAGVAAGSWTDLGTIVMNRSGNMPNPDAVAVSPPVFPGATLDVEIHGRGFFPGPALNVTITSPGITLESFSFVDWATIRATVTVAPGAAPGRRDVVRVTNPDGGYDTGGLMVLPGERALFADGFEQ